MSDLTEQVLLVELVVAASKHLTARDTLAALRAALPEGVVLTSEGLARVERAPTGRGQWEALYTLTRIEEQ